MRFFLCGKSLWQTAMRQTGERDYSVTALHITPQILASVAFLRRGFLRCAVAVPQRSAAS